MTLESAIEFIAADELVEVTPQAIRCASGCSRSTTAAASAAARRTGGDAGPTEEAAQRR